MGCVYVISNLVNGQQYVGLSKHTADVRFKGHVRDAERGKETILHRAIRKHGVANFKVETLFVSEDRDELAAFEIAAIDTLSTRRPHGYNITGGGEAPFGELNGRYGTKHTAETKQKMRENNAMRNPIHRAKLQGENHPMFGVKQDPEKMKAAGLKRRGRVWMTAGCGDVPVAPAHIEMYRWLGFTFGRGYRPSEATCQAMSSTRRGRAHTGRTREKMSASQKQTEQYKSAEARRCAIRNLRQAGFSITATAHLLFISTTCVKRNQLRTVPSTIDSLPETL